MSDNNLFPCLIGTLSAEIITLPICTITPFNISNDDYL